MNNELEMAEQQFLGYFHGKMGYSVVALAKDMGLRKDEWEELQYQVPLDEDDMNELDEYFKGEE